eukprot:INCI8928.1.p1 GENE.INCI8928.1~~INCI8928.1.p1  ORF type:complete len:508 (+),score=46.33 INCI8928.1:277-1800(+)
MRRYLVSKSKPPAPSRVLQGEDRAVSCSRIFEGKSSAKTKTYGRAKKRSPSPQADSAFDSPSPSSAVASPHSVSTPTTATTKSRTRGLRASSERKHSTLSMSPAAQPLTPPTSQSPRIKFPRGVCQVEGDDDDSDEGASNQCEGEEPVVGLATRRTFTVQQKKQVLDQSLVKRKTQPASIFSNPLSSRKRFFSRSTGHGIGAYLPPSKSLRTLRVQRLKREPAATETSKDSPTCELQAHRTSTGRCMPASFHPTESHKLVQATIDLGQRGSGGSKCCPRCGMLYTRGSQEDEESHRTFCASVRTQRVTVAHKHLSSGRGVRVIRGAGLKKAGSKGVLQGRRLAPASNSTHAVTNRPCYIAEISAGASKYAADKLRQLHRIMAEHMGTVSDCDSLMQSSQTRHYLFLLSNGFVAGCLVAQSIRCAFVMSHEPVDDESGEVSGQSSSRSSDVELLIKHHETSEKADIGVSQVWVHSAYRRGGIASQLIDAARKHMIYGHTVPKSKVVRC